MFVFANPAYVAQQTIIGAFGTGQAIYQETDLGAAPAA